MQLPLLFVSVFFDCIDVIVHWPMPAIQLLPSIFFTGSGEPEACEARVDLFVRSVGFAGLIAIACAVFALGVMGTLVMQACYTRLTSKDKWHEQEGHKV